MYVERRWVIPYCFKRFVDMSRDLYVWESTGMETFRSVKTARMAVSVGYDSETYWDSGGEAAFERCLQGSLNGKFN